MDNESFDIWNSLKKKLNRRNRPPSIIEGEIWWCSVGKNIGIEINGKGNRFTRPVLIFKKLSNLGFVGIPLTSQPKTGSWYVAVKFLEKKEFFALCQARTFSVFRLQEKIGEITKTDLKTIKIAFIRLHL